MKQSVKAKMSSTKILLFGMLIIILIGTVLLRLPISNQTGKSISFIDSLFISTSAVCVTGLTTKISAEQFTLFGQVVIMCLIQIGGLRFYDINIININVYW